MTSTISFSPARIRLWLRNRHGRNVAEVATLRAHRTPELLRVPLHVPGNLGKKQSVDDRTDIPTQPTTPFVVHASACPPKGTSSDCAGCDIIVVQIRAVLRVLKNDICPRPNFLGLLAISFRMRPAVWGRSADRRGDRRVAPTTLPEFLRRIYPFGDRGLKSGHGGTDGLGFWPGFICRDARPCVSTGGVWPWFNV